MDFVPGLGDFRDELDESVPIRAWKLWAPNCLGSEGDFPNRSLLGAFEQPIYLNRRGSSFSFKNLVVACKKGVTLFVFPVGGEC